MVYFLLTPGGSPKLGSGRGMPASGDVSDNAASSSMASSASLLLPSRRARRSSSTDTGSEAGPRRGLFVRPNQVRSVPTPTRCSLMIRLLCRSSTFSDPRPSLNSAFYIYLVALSSPSLIPFANISLPSLPSNPIPTFHLSSSRACNLWSYQQEKWSAAKLASRDARNSYSSISPPGHRLSRQLFKLFPFQRMCVANLWS